MKRIRLLGGVMLCGLALLTGCASRGPGYLTRDRMKYTTAMATSWEEQVLLNVVKIQYAEVPTFLEVANIVGGYETSGGFGISGQYSTNPLFHEDKINSGIDARMVERPTITYTPVSGEKFARQVMVPVPAAVVLSLIQAGWRADRVMLGLIRTVNGVRNRLPRMEGDQPGDPQFVRIVVLMQQLQDAGAVDFRVQLKGKDADEAFMTIRPAPDLEASQLAELRELLGLGADATEVPLRFGLLHAERNELSITTLSMLQAMMALGDGVELPPEHVAQCRARSQVASGDAVPSMKVHCAAERPADAYVAVRHQGYWFWVAGNDLRSKTSLMSVCLLMKVLESGDSQKPVLTIPTR